MAGPTSSVLLRNIPDAIQKGQIYNVLDKISSYRKGNDFWVNDTSSIGGTLQSEVDFFAMSNGEIDHRILGELMYFFAKELNGIINFNGAIYENEELSQNWAKTILGQNMKWEEVQTYHKKFTRNMNGNLHSILYETSSGSMAIRQICDVEFMENWLKHDRFHMIK